MSPPPSSDFSFNKKSAIVLSLGVLLRSALYSLSTDLQHVLDGRVEITTPVSSFKRLQEGVFLYSTKSISNNFNIYEGGVFHQSPILLALFTTLQTYNISSHIPYIIADVIAAYCIHTIASTLASRASSRDTAFAPWAVTAVYLFNPFSLLGSIAQSTNIFSNMLILSSTAAAVSWKRPLLSMALLALATCLSLYPICLLPPLVSIASSSSDIQNTPNTTVVEKYKIRNVSSSQKEEDYENKNEESKIKSKSIISWIVLVLGYLVYIGVFLYISYLIAGNSWKFIESTYFTIIFLTDLTPNIGLWWYFFVEMFTFFRPFFICVFQLFVSSFSIPITVRFHAFPLFGLATVVGINTLFRSYPESSDLGLYLSLIALFKPVLSHIKYQLAVILAFLYSSALAPTFYHLWIYLGSGNSNFFYAITLVYALGITISLTDTTWVALRLEYDAGKNSRLTQL